MLGPVRVTLDAREIGRLGTKALGLLVYLACPAGKVHSREYLAALLWPDRFEEQARQSLRQTLSILRKALEDDGAIIVTTEGGIGLAADQVSTDIEAFERLAQADDAQALQQAAAFLRGDFFAAGPRVSREFDDWADAERRRLRDAAAGVLEAIAQEELAAGRPGEALAAARTLLAHDPVHEHGHRIAIEALARSGRKTAALRQFESCREALARELDVEPDAETLALVERVRASQFVPEGEAQGAAPLAPSGRTGPVRRVSPRRLRTAGTAIAVLGLMLVLLLAQRMFGPESTTSGSAPPPGSELEAPSAALACAPTGAPHNPTDPAVVVLPLDRDATRPELDVFAEATSETIVEFLAMVPGLTVVNGPPRGHADYAKSTRELAGDLGVTHVLDGSVRASDDEVRVSLRLEVGETGETEWTYVGRIAFPFANQFADQDRIAVDTMRAVQEHLTEGGGALRYRTYETAAVEVFEHATLGFNYLNRMAPATNERAREEYRAALAMDPTDPAATSGLAWTHIFAALFAWSSTPQEELDRATELLDVTIESDPAYYYAYSAQGVVALLEGDHERAVERAEEALRISGSAGDAYIALAFILTYAGENARAVELAEQAMRIRPYTYPMWYEWVLARARRLNGDVEGALACLSADDVRQAGTPMPALELAAAYSESGQSLQAGALMGGLQLRTSRALTADLVCSWPPYATEALTERCVADLARAGLPRAAE